MTKLDARKRLCVADPATALRATKQERDKKVSITFLIWLVLGFRSFSQKYEEELTASGQAAGSTSPTRQSPSVSRPKKYAIFGPLGHPYSPCVGLQSESFRICGPRLVPIPLGCAERAPLEVRANNMVALQFVLRSTGSSESMIRTVREFAHDLGDVVPTRHGRPHSWCSITCGGYS